MSTEQIQGLSGDEMAKLEHTQKVDTERRWLGGGGGATASEQTHRFASGRRRVTVPGAEKGAGQARGGARSTGDAGDAVTPDTLTLEPGSSRGRPYPRLTPRGKGTRPPGARRGGKSAREAPARPGKRRGHGPSYPCKPKARRR